MGGVVPRCLQSGKPRLGGARRLGPHSDTRRRRPPLGRYFRWLPVTLAVLRHLSYTPPGLPVPPRCPSEAAGFSQRHPGKRGLWVELSCAITGLDACSRSNCSQPHMSSRCSRQSVCPCLFHRLGRRVATFSSVSEVFLI